MNPYKTINALYDHLERACDNRSWVNPVKQMYKMNLQDEKSYRNSGRGSDNPKFTANLAAKYFTVKHILDGKESKLSAKDILHIRLSCFYGEAIAKEYTAEVNHAITIAPQTVNDFLSLDYAKLMEGE